jgi:hypothetical protein
MRRLLAAVFVISALFAVAKVHTGSIISRSGMVTPNAELTNLVAVTASDVVQVVL